MKPFNAPKKLIILALLTFLSAGCASKNPFVEKYEVEKSLALNIINRAEINPFLKIKDTEVPAGVKQHVANTGEYAALNSIVRFNFPAAGVSGLAAGGLGLLEALTAPKEHAEQIHLLAWVPVDKASSAHEAQEVLFDQSKEAVKNALQNLNLEFKREEVHIKNNVMVYAAIFEGTGNCQSNVKGKVCALMVRIARPRKKLRIIPSQIDPARRTMYTFYPDGLRDLNSTVFVEMDGAYVKHPEIIKALADNMPSLSAIYVPPMTRKETIGTKFPYVLKDGKYELFITEHN